MEFVARHVDSYADAVAVWECIRPLRGHAADAPRPLRCDRRNVDKFWVQCDKYGNIAFGLYRTWLLTYTPSGCMIDVSYTDTMLTRRIINAWTRHSVTRVRSITHIDSRPVPTARSSVMVSYGQQYDSDPVVFVRTIRLPDALRAKIEAFSERCTEAFNAMKAMTGSWRPAIALEDGDPLRAKAEMWGRSGPWHPYWQLPPDAPLPPECALVEPPYVFAYGRETVRSIRNAGQCISVSDARSLLDKYDLLDTANVLGGD